MKEVLIVVSLSVCAVLISWAMSWSVVQSQVMSQRLDNDLTQFEDHATELQTLSCSGHAKQREH